jgi:hypothetical protein
LILAGFVAYVVADPVVRAAVVWTGLILAGFVAHVIADSGVRASGDRLVVAAASNSGLELVRLVLEFLGLGALTFGFGQALLGVALTVSRPQLGLRSLTSGCGCSLIGRCLSRFGLGRESGGFLTMISSLDLPTFLGLPAHTRQNQCRDDGQHDDNDDDHNDPRLHSTPPKVDRYPSAPGWPSQEMVDV